MGKPLVDQIREADPNVASEYQAVMKDKSSMDVQGVKRVFAKVMENSLISAGEAKALLMIINSGVLSADARKLLIAALSDTQSFAAMVNGSYHILKKDDKNDQKELEAFYKAFDKTANIDFWSQRSVRAYNPAQYQVIKQAVKVGVVRVVKVLDGGLYSNLAGGNFAKYAPGLNVLFVFQPRTGSNFFADVPLLVHEVTHAIQDFYDMKGILTKFTEADAYVAQAVASLIPGQTLTGNTPLEKAALKAAGFVQKKTAVRSNQDWKDAYDEVVAAVAVHPEYAKVKDVEVDMTEDGTELQIMLDSLQSLEKRKPVPAGK